MSPGTPGHGAAVAAGEAALVRAAPLKCQPNLGIFEDFFYLQPHQLGLRVRKELGSGEGAGKDPPISAAGLGGDAQPPPHGAAAPSPNLPSQE